MASDLKVPDEEKYGVLLPYVKKSVFLPIILVIQIFFHIYTNILLFPFLYCKQIKQDLKTARYLFLYS